MKKQHSDITYLKNEQISKVLFDGFAELYHNKPQFPVTYLANYLLSYAKTKNQESQIEKILQTKRKIIQESHHKIADKLKRTTAQQTNILNHLRSLEQFKTRIKTHDAHIDMLNDFCDRLEKEFHLAGVYIGELKHPKRTVKPGEESETAHLDLEAPKRIQYLAWSNSHKQLMAGKYLILDSVTGGVFAEKQVEEVQQGKQKEQQKDYVYVPDVVKNQRMVYFRLPKLGAYMGVPMIYKSYLNEASFDSGIQETLKYKKAFAQYQTQKQKKQNQFHQLYSQKQKQGADQKELEQIESRYQRQKSSTLAPQEPKLNSINTSYVVCFDTLGLQREIPLDTRKHLVDYVNLFRDSWQLCELKYLKADIELQIKYTQGFDMPLTDYLTKIGEDQQKQLDTEIEELAKQKLPEKEHLFEVESLKLEKIKDSFNNDQRYQSYLYTLLNMNVIKFSGILQAALYFLGYPKNNVNFRDTNVLNWRAAKEIIKKGHFLKRISQYSHRGSKTKAPLPEAKWSKILGLVQKYDLNTVTSYNILLGKLMKLLMLTAKLRKTDCEIRREKVNELRRIREERRIQNQRIQSEKVKELQQQRRIANEKIEKGQDAQFDEETWEFQYNEAHPLYDLGDLVPDEIDQDYEVPE